MKSYKVITLILLFLSATSLCSAQEFTPPPPFGSDPVEEESLGSHYISAYDSLMDSYYMRKYATGHTRHTKDDISEAFDQVQDSVIIRRLRSLHTIIPMTYNDEVRAYIRMYLRIMSTRLDVMLTLSEFYHPMFEEVLTRNGVPEELKYLTIVESAMNPMATSRVGAAGLWQFMYSTGKLYHLEVNSIIDDRRDPYKSTEAAAHYLHDLYTVFNDWTLAIAAYNCGPGNINKAIARSGGQQEFWHIYPYLPRETRGYIPAFIAATYVMNFYRDHGLTATEFELPIHADTLTLHHDVLFCHIEQATGVSVDELRTLNPQYRTDFIPASTGAYTVCVPVKYMHALIANEDSMYRWSQDSLSKKPIVIAPAKGSGRNGGGKGTRYHTVKKGESLSAIARKYGTTITALKKKNKIKGDKLKVGQKIRVK